VNKFAPPPKKKPAPPAKAKPKSAATADHGAEPKKTPVAAVKAVKKTASKKAAPTGRSSRAGAKKVR
jgi:hypothetical protein